MASQRTTVCKLHTSTHRTGIKFDPYTYLPFHGLYAENGELRRGVEGEAKGPDTIIPAPAVAAPKNCCGKLGNP
jgi:hypothetical protein